jgi:putative phosphonate metabolism protein
MEPASRYAIYFVPPADSAIYRFGSSVLGYDCYTGERVAHPGEVVCGAASWDRMVEEPRRYGFHATLKAPFYLSSTCTQAQLIDALRGFASSGLPVPAIVPVIGLLDNFAAVVPQDHERALDELAARCTTVFDPFRAPLSQQERARRMAAGLSQSQIENLERWGYPYTFSDFRFHMTLTGQLAADAQAGTLAILRRSFGRLCGCEMLLVDSLTLLKQDAAQANFRVLSQAQLRTAA